MAPGSQQPPRPQSRRPGVRTDPELSQQPPTPVCKGPCGPALIRRSLPPRCLGDRLLLTSIPLLLREPV